LYAEKWCSFTKELAVMVVRTEDDAGELTSLKPYPAVETIHEDSICTKTSMPPRGVPKQACEKARETACQVISTLQGRGVFAVEMFLLEDGETPSLFPSLPPLHALETKLIRVPGSILVNEVAPRPHN
jgi:phosphoribosylaminoimidazole carboxylase